MSTQLSFAALLNRAEIAFPSATLREAVGGRRILVTGAGGSIGSALAARLITLEPAALVLVDSHEASLFRLGNLLSASGSGFPAQYVLADLRDRAKLDRLFGAAAPDVVFHLAAYKQVPLSEQNVDAVIDVNILATVDLIDLAAAHAVATFVYPSTDKAVVPPSVYGASKRVVERVIQARALQGDRPALRLLRLVNVAGTQGSVVEVFSRQIQAGQPVTITDLRMDRYWMTMAEATGLALVTSGRRQFEGIHLLQVGAPVPLVETVGRLAELVQPGGPAPEIREMGIRPGERLHELLSYPDERCRATDVAGLDVLELPPPVISAAEWDAALHVIRDRLLDFPISRLRSWLFGAATAASAQALASAGAPSEGE
jgi:O-antigen biosynthesis protein WbqV